MSPKKRKDQELLTEVSAHSKEFQQDVGPIIAQNYWFNDSKKLFRFTSCFLVRNRTLSDRFEQRRKDLRNAVRSTLHKGRQRHDLVTLRCEHLSEVLVDSLSKRTDRTVLATQIAEQKAATCLLKKLCYDIDKLIGSASDMLLFDSDTDEYKKRLGRLANSFLELAAATVNIRMAGQKVLTKASLNPNIERMEYAVRGPMVIRAIELQKELQMGANKPFREVIRANIGDAHAMGQQPITFLRQILAASAYPALLDQNVFPTDVVDRVRTMLTACGGTSIGAYTNSAGIDMVRGHIAKFIAKRDHGVPCDPDEVFLCGGASEGIRSLLTCFRDVPGKPAGIMVPIPQYPLYSASNAEFGLHQVNYYLDEENNWSLRLPELERAIEAAKSACDPKVIVVINPGNPTGQVLSRENIEDIIKFAHKHHLVIFADEVYQENVYGEGCQFHSFKEVLKSLGAPYANMELASFNSISKGFTGECGLRGGYSELINFDPDCIAMYKKSVTARLCCCATGQLMVDCMVKPPEPGQPSYELFEQERQDRLASLANRAKLTAEILNSIKGIKCNPVQGAMYAFPNIHLPEKLVKKAESLGQKPDFFYCMNLLERKGICVIPGSGFGQRDGTYHFRTTILPQPPLLKSMLENLKSFHEQFISEFE